MIPLAFFRLLVLKQMSAAILTSLFSGLTMDFEFLFLVFLFYLDHCMVFDNRREQHVQMTSLLSLGVYQKYNPGSFSRWL